ncbi:MAG: TetR family transcriptional regulator [Streptosporangiales bacterium]|nr:TetR family transcriptional regulator [Streptosporangiales bacterium]
MSSIYGSDDRPPGDLTARARIRDAALAQFAEHGVKGATIKGIADAAGVSTGLVQHHFGSKEALRKACDEAVIEVFRRRLTRSLTEGEITNPDFMTALYETSAPLVRYLARGTVDGSPAAAYVFDQLASGAEEFLTGTWPERFPPGSQQATDGASVMAAMHGGTIVLHDHLARRMGVDPLEREHSTRLAMAMFEIYTSMGEFARSEVGTQIHDAVTKYGEGTASHEEERDHDNPNA